MFRKIKFVTDRIVRVVQKVLITAALAVLYFLGFGITLLFGLLFRRDLLCTHTKGNLWRKTGNPEFHESEFTQQS